VQAMLGFILVEQQRSRDEESAKFRVYRNLAHLFVRANAEEKVEQVSNRM
jgi:hypothetical protein